MIRWLRSALQGEVRPGARGAARRRLVRVLALPKKPRRMSPLFRLCAWNAFALQTIADKLIEADSAADPATEGYVPRSTLGYMSVCVDLVQHWIPPGPHRPERSRCARRGAARPAAGLASRRAHCRESELQGLRAAYEALQARVETALTASSAPELRRVDAEMRSAADYATAIWHPKAGAAERERPACISSRRSSTAFTLGQLLALPTLGEIERVRSDRGAGLPLRSHPSWLQIGSGWPVLDGVRETVGLVYRVCGDRATGQPDGVDVSHSVRQCRYLPCRRLRRSPRSTPGADLRPRVARADALPKPRFLWRPVKARPRLPAALDRGHRCRAQARLRQLADEACAAGHDRRRRRRRRSRPRRRAPCSSAAWRAREQARRLRRRGEALRRSGRSSSGSSRIGRGRSPRRGARATASGRSRGFKRLDVDGLQGRRHAAHDAS